MNDYYCALMDSPYDLYHHGVKGMKWGVRRWQNHDGTYTAAGKAHYGFGDGKIATRVKGTAQKAVSSVKRTGSKVASKVSSKTKRLSTGQKVAIGVGAAAAGAAIGYGIYASKKAGIFNKDDTRTLREKIQAVKEVPLNDIKSMKEYKNTYVLGMSTKDRILNSGTEFSRIQTSDTFEDHGAYYATYRKHDINEYTGLFGKNLKSRAGEAAGKEAAKKAYDSAIESGMSRHDAANAARKAKATTSAAVTKATKVFRVSLGANSDLNVASDTSASKVTADILKNDTDGSFKSDLKKSIDHGLQTMRRPNQQILFKRAQRALDKAPEARSKSEKSAIYQALNLTLTSHEDYENRVQNTFYDAMRKAGYDAIDDVNDRNFSSYHAHRPTIVFNTAKTAVSGIKEVSDNEINRYAVPANIERSVKEGLMWGGGGAVAGTSIAIAADYYNNDSNKQKVNSVKEQAADTTIDEARKQQEAA